MLCNDNDNKVNQSNKKKKRRKNNYGLKKIVTSELLKKEDVPLVEFTYFVFTRMPGES